MKKYQFSVYLITNLINQKKYVGKTKKTLKERFNDHVKAAKHKRSNMIILKAIRKYGKENFKIELLDSSANTDEELKILEGKYISSLNTLIPNGYNIESYSDGNTIVHPETIFKIKSKLQGVKRKGQNTYVGVRKSSKITWEAELGETDIGHYDSGEKAAEAYDLKAIEVFGLNAKLNFPSKLEYYLTKPNIEKFNPFSHASKNLQGFRYKNNNNKFTGVRISRNKKRFGAVINFLGKRIRIGMFSSEIEAAEAYDKKAIELFGSNAKINFPKEKYINTL